MTVPAKDGRPERHQDGGRAWSVVFDLDGTVLRPGCALQRAHMRTMAEAVEAETGIRAEFRHQGGDLFVFDHSLSGYTDAGTVALLLELGGTPGDRVAGLVDRVVAAMCRRLTDEMAGLDARDDLLPGVAELVAELCSAGAVIGLSTGNARRVAACKVRAVGLDCLAAHGAFGDRHRDRVDIVRDAVASVQAAAEALSRTLHLRDITLVGDTPSDVLAARAAGVRSLAVSTGAAAPERLRGVRPDLLFRSLAGMGVADLVAAPVGSGALDPHQTG
ncbi:MAG: HAD family hydrolase [Labedaea sp.]